MIQVLQAVANYPESKDFLESMSRTFPGLQTLLDVPPLKPDGSMLASPCPGPSTSAAPSALSPVSTLSPISDEPGRKRTSPHVLTGAVSANDSPTSRPRLPFSRAGQPHHHPAPLLHLRQHPVRRRIIRTQKMWLDPW